MYSLAAETQATFRYFWEEKACDFWGRTEPQTVRRPTLMLLLLELLHFSVSFLCLIINSAQESSHAAVGPSAVMRAPTPRSLLVLPAVDTAHWDMVQGPERWASHRSPLRVSTCPAGPVVDYPQPFGLGDRSRVEGGSLAAGDTQPTAVDGRPTPVGRGPTVVSRRLAALRRPERTGGCRFFFLALRRGAVSHTPPCGGSLQRVACRSTVACL